MLTLGQVETMCARAMMRSEAKMEIGDYTVYIADGYSSKPHVTYQRFGVAKGEFPFGAYATLAFIAEGELVRIGLPLIFDALHDSHQGWPREVKKKARINTAMAKARDALDVYKRDVTHAPV